MSPGKSRGFDRGSRLAPPAPARPRRARAALVPLAVLLLVILACGSVPKRYYFALSYPLEPVSGAAARAPLHPFRVRIRPFTVALPYNRPQIVYRQSPFEFNYYSYRMWAAKPQHMLRELAERHLDAARLVQEVTREYGEQLPDYELSAEVLAIEEYDSGDVWFGHLAMRFELVRFSDKIPIWTHFFDRKRKVWEKQPVYVVRALSALAEEEMIRVTAELDAVLSRERDVDATLAQPPPASDDAPPGPSDGAPPPRFEVGPAERPASPPEVRREDELILPDEPAPPSGPGGGTR